MGERTASTTSRLVGSRFECDGSRGTVVWAGMVRIKGVEEPSWLGVEWDDPTRGKSTGSVEDVQYFVPARRDVCSYSFLKEHRIRTAMCFVEAIKAKYGPSPPSSGQEEEPDVIVFGPSQGQRVPVEVVGREQVQQRFGQLNTLQCASLQDSLFGLWGDSVGRDGIPINLVELDLTNTLIRDWGEVIQICKNLTKLETLSLGHNRFLAIPELNHGAYNFPLKSLTLNNTNMHWSKAVSICGACFPQLQELHFCSNRLERVDGVYGVCAEGKPVAEHTLTHSLGNLRLLNLEENEISSWDQVWLLSSLPSLEKLILNENKIPLVSHDGERSRFPQLKSISLDQNAISEWESVDQLNKFPQLHTLRLRWNPLNEKMGPGLARMVVTARIAKLTLLNGSEVSAAERTEAEKYYLKQCYKPPGEDQDVRQAHPRYSELLECYGQPTVATANPANSHTLGDSLISVHLRSMVVTGRSNGLLECTRNVPVDMKILNLKQLCQQIFGTGHAPISLFLCTSHTLGLEHLDDEMKELSYYGAKDGCEILVKQKLP